MNDKPEDYQAPNQPLIEVVLSMNGAQVQVIDRRPEPTTQEEMQTRAIEHEQAIQEALSRTNTSILIR